jgi:hypothetical protein
MPHGKYARTESRAETFESPEDRLRRLDWLSRILDLAFPIPGTRFRIGLDGLLGLIPGVGDPVGAALSSYLIFEAARLGVPKLTLIRMIGNVAIESLVGIVPILGDIFDIAWKANVRNMALLRAHSGELNRRIRSPHQVVVLVVAALVVIFLILMTISMFTLRFLYQWITS